MEFNKYFDHTFLKAFATKQDIDMLCQQAKELNTASVCVNEEWVAYCKNLLKDTDVMICSVVGFPLGQCGLNTKAYETKEALKDGADLKLLEMARDMRYADVPIEEAQKKLLAAGATQIEMALLQEMYAFLQFRKDCNKELEGLKEIMPHCFHMHGKFHYLSEDLVEASIPYDQILDVVKNSDYDGYIVSEYEDHESGNAVEMTRRHQAMMRKILRGE